MRRFFRRAFSVSPFRAWVMTFKNECQFAQVVIDRFATYAGAHFEFEIDGYEHYLRLAHEPGAFIQLSAHIGNYELAGYSLKADNKPFNALVFSNEKESVMLKRQEQFLPNNIHMVMVKPDMSHIYEINDLLTRGETLSIPGDRIFGSQKTFRLPFLGSEAEFPQGPFTVAASRNLPVLFVAVMKQKRKKYHIQVSELPYDTTLPSVKDKAQEIAQSYCAELEQTVRKYPLQWYNYFDFWS